MEEQIWARSVIMLTERLHAVAHLMAYSFSSFQYQRPDWKALFFPPDVSSPPSHSPHLHLSPPVTNCSCRLQSLSLVPGNKQCVSWIDFLSSVFSILSFLVFPLSSHTVVFHLPRPPCHASGQGADSHQCSVFVFCFFLSFGFVFHLHPA